MPGIIVAVAEGKEPRVISIHETLYSAKKELVNRVGNPLYYYNVQEISGEVFTQIKNLISLPSFPCSGEDTGNKGDHD